MLVGHEDEVGDDTSRSDGRAGYDVRILVLRQNLKTLYCRRRT